MYGMFRTQCLPYMEGSELSASLAWNVQSLVLCLYRIFRSQRLFLVGMCTCISQYIPQMGCSDLSTCTFLIWNAQISVHVPSLYGMFRSQYMYLPYMGCSDLSTCASLIWKVQISAHVPSLCGTFSAQCCPYTTGLKKGLYTHPTFYSVSCTANSSKHPPVSCETALGTQVYVSVRVCRNSGKKTVYSQQPPSPIPNHIKSHSPLEVQTFQFHH